MNDVRIAALKKAVSIMGVAAVLAGLAACGGDSSSDADSSKGRTDAAATSSAQERVAAALEPQTSVGMTTPLNAPPEKGKLVYYIRYNTEGLSKQLDSWPDIAAEAGWEGRLLSVDPADPQGGANAIKQAVAAKADYIAVTAQSLEALAPGMDVAKAEGVPVFFTFAVGDPEGKTNGLYGSVAGLPHMVDLGTKPLDWVIADSEGAGNVLWVNYPDAPIIAEQEPQVRAWFEKNCPECTYNKIDASTSMLSNGEVATAIVAEIRKNPDIKYVATSFDAPSTGLREALDSAGLTDVKIALAGAQTPQLEMLRSDGLDYAVVTGAQEASWALLDQMLRLDQGMDVLQQEHATRPVQAYDRDTLGDTTGWDGPQGFENAYRKLWNVS